MDGRRVRSRTTSGPGHGSACTLGCSFQARSTITGERGWQRTCSAADRAARFPTGPRPDCTDSTDTVTRRPRTCSCHFESGVLFEIDGAAVHGGADALRRDLRRQNELTESFDVVRYSAADVLGNPGGIARHAAQRVMSRTCDVASCRNIMGAWTRNGWIVTRRADAVWDVRAA